MIHPSDTKAGNTIGIMGIIALLLLMAMMYEYEIRRFFGDDPMRKRDSVRTLQMDTIVPETMRPVYDSVKQ